MTSPSTSTTSGTFTRRTQLLKVDWSQEEKAIEGTDGPCSSRQWTRWTVHLIKEKLKPRIAPYKHTWRSHHNTVFGAMKASSEKKIAILSNSVACNYSLRHITAIRIDKVVCMKTMEELYCSKYESPRLHRVTLVPSSQHVQKDVLVSESRKSDDRENEVHQHRETCGSDHCVDFRIPGISHSAVEQVETNRKEKVRRFIEQFESHPNKNLLLKDYKKSEEINHFSQESKELIAEMGNNEIFDFYETSSKRQCPDCALYWAIGIVFFTCGKCTQPSERYRQLNKDRFDSLSITNPEVPGLVNQCVK